MIEAALQRVRRVLSLPGVTPAGLAKRAELHPNSLYSALSDDWNPSANTLKALEPVLREVELEKGVVEHAGDSNGGATVLSPDMSREIIGRAVA